MTWYIASLQIIIIIIFILFFFSEYSTEL